MNASPILLAVPMSFELDRLRATLRRLPRDRVMPVVVGVGAAAGQRLGGMLLSQPAEMVLGIGFGGALEPLLQAGDIIVGNRVVSRDGTEWWADERLRERVEHSLRAVPLPFATGTILSADQPVL
jgi:hypothetical protein